MMSWSHRPEARWAQNKSGRSVTLGPERGEGVGVRAYGWWRMYEARGVLAVDRGGGVDVVDREFVGGGGVMINWNSNRVNCGPRFGEVGSGVVSSGVVFSVVDVSNCIWSVCCWSPEAGGACGKSGGGPRNTKWPPMGGTSVGGVCGSSVYDSNSNRHNGHVGD